MTNDKLPWFKFFSKDYLGDGNLQVCSLEAQGLWTRMLCYMDQSERRGYLQVGDLVILPLNLANMVGKPRILVEKLLKILEKANVFSRENGTNCIYSRRMVRDHAASLAHKAAGKQGGNPVLLKPGDKPPLKPSRTRVPESRSQSPEGIDNEDNSYSPSPREQRLIDGKDQPEGPAFKRFIDRYGRDIDRGPCWDYWRENNFDAKEKEIMEGLDRWKVSQRWFDGYKDDPLNWLKKERWTNHPRISEANTSII